ncbi:unnamed protein product, partial [Choristocarpus tenellus]
PHLPIPPPHSFDDVGGGGAEGSTAGGMMGGVSPTSHIPTAETVQHPQGAPPSEVDAGERRLKQNGTSDHVEIESGHQHQVQTQSVSPSQHAHAVWAHHAIHPQGNNLSMTAARGDGEGSSIDVEDLAGGLEKLELEVQGDERQEQNIHSQDQDDRDTREHIPKFGLKILVPGAMAGCLIGKMISWRRNGLSVIEIPLYDYGIIAQGS